MSHSAIQKPAAAANITPKKKTTKVDVSSKTFESYWSLEDVQTGLTDGSLIEGVLRINPKNYKEAFISSPDGTEDDILIEGLLNRNRALNGDVVVCQILPQIAEICPASAPGSMPTEQHLAAATSKEHTGKKSLPTTDGKAQSEETAGDGLANTGGKKVKSRNRQKKKQFSNKALKENHLSPAPDGTASATIEVSEGQPDSTIVANVEGESALEVKPKRTRRSKRTKNRSSPANKESVGVDSTASKSVIDQLATLKIAPVPDSSETLPGSEAPTRRNAKVVFVKEWKHSRRAIGHLRQWPYGQCGPVPKWVLFAPKDHRIPRLKLPYSADISAFMAQPNMLFLAQIVSWVDINYPVGTLCYVVGNSGEIEAETLGILLEHDVDYRPFPDNILNDLPSLPWSVPAEELAKRRDFRNQCVFTIDPSDARDLDDAVCGRYLRTGDDGVRLYQISVHIADVSFFVREDTQLDEMASQRATSTYLVDRVIPMLPSVLCEHVCSLNPGEDRLTFSVEWVVNDRGEILEEWFGRSVINSCVKLSYDHAQAVIEGREDIDWPEIRGEHTVADVRRSIQVLQELAGHLRKKRVDQGALRIDLPRLAFSMDWTTRTPVGFRLYELKESNRLIEEFMLLANMRVAERIYKSFPAIAVLRCHPPPFIKKLVELANTLQTVGIHLNVTSSAAIQESLIHYGQGGNDHFAIGRHLVISNLLAKPMKCACYVCSGTTKDEAHFRHYALSVPFYTHFTSPIRRYPDILVHRLLNAALEREAMDHWQTTAIKKVLENCNDRKLAAKAVQDKHAELHLANLIRKCGSVEAKGIVLGVLDHSVDIVLLYLGVIRRLYFDKLPLDQMVHEKCNGLGRLTLVWKPEVAGTSALRQVISVFSLLEIQLVPHAESDKLDFNLVLLRPTNIAEA